MVDDVDEEAPIFAIAVAAELAGMHPQTLRQYDRVGLVVPARTQGGSRRYALRHVKQLREVAALSAEGMSLPAISRPIELENTVPGLRRQVAQLENRLQDEESRRSRVFAAGCVWVGRQLATARASAVRRRSRAASAVRRGLTAVRPRRRRRPARPRTGIRSRQSVCVSPPAPRGMLRSRGATPRHTPAPTRRSHR